MKIMQINNVYKNGSTGKIVYDIHTYLQEHGYESTVAYGRLECFDEPNVYKICGELEARINRTFTRISGILYGSSLFSTNRLIKLIKNVKPDVVHLQCINGFFVNIYKIISFLKKEKIKTVLTLHAEFMYTANCGHALDCEKWKYGCGCCPRLKKETCTFLLDNTALSWKKMKKAFDGFDKLTVVSVSPWLQERAQQSPILANKRYITILNGIDTSIFNPKDVVVIKKKLKLVGKKIVFHATASFSGKYGHYKGGYYVLEMARRFLKIDPNVVFIVAGEHDKAIEVPPNVILLGNVTRQSELAEYYSIADVTLLTSEKETFSMVVAESLCCGTPVVGFEAGAPEMITIDEYSEFVPQGDFDKLFESVKEYIYFKKFDRPAISNVAKTKYSKEVMGENYLKLYEEIIKKI